jgi:hypothetical protein
MAPSKSAFARVFDARRAGTTEFRGLPDFAALDPGHRLTKHATGTCGSAARFCGMNCQRVIEAALRAAQDFLWQNAPPMHYVADDVTVARLRGLVRSPAIQAALLQSSDTFLTFVLRAVEIVVSDQSQDDREIIGRLWDVLDEPHLNQALGIQQNSRILFGPYPRRR